MADKKTKVSSKSAKTDKASTLIPDDKVILLTKDGLEALRQELSELENNRRKEIAEKIKEAVSYGDLSENSEYEEAKNEQAFVEGRILQLTEQIKYAQIIDDEVAKQRSKGERFVQLGNKVKIRALSGKVVGEVFEYSIVGTTEADPYDGKISNESPVGAALLNTKVGEKIQVNAPVGMITYEVLAIS